MPNSEDEKSCTVAALLWLLENVAEAALRKKEKQAWADAGLAPEVIIHVLPTDDESSDHEHKD